MTHWDVPHASWDDSYGDPHHHLDPPPEGRYSAGKTPGGRHSAEAEDASWTRPVSPARPVPPPQRPVSPAFGPPPTFGPAPSFGGPPPARPVSPARPISPARGGRPVSPPGFGVAPPQRPVSPSGPPPYGSYGLPQPQSGPPSRPYRPDSGRSHWVGEDGVDHRGRLIIDPDDIDLDEDDEHTESRFSRRTALLALGGVAAGTAVALSPQGLDLASKLFGGPAEKPEALSHDNLPGDGSNRPAGQQASSARTYAEQNESYNGSEAGDQLRQNTPQSNTVKASPGQAAAAAKPLPKPVAISALGDDPVRHLASRVTFGVTPQVVKEINRLGIDQWIAVQLEPSGIADTRAEQKLSELTTLTKSIDQLRADAEANGKAGINADDEMVEATIARQIWSDRQLFEVMVDFWHDFLHVGPFEGAEIQRPSFDRDVIRKYALDNYPDMFVAANRHPALLNYLDQNQSRKDAVNENLARENLELFSVGVDGGYTEKDVRQAALLQTGRSIRDDKYVYRPEQHFVGPVTILGFSHPNATAAGGEAAAEEYFRYLAMHPSTARYIALNLCTRLVSDTPPTALVDEVSASYLSNQGKIKPMLVTLLSSTVFWGSVGLKYRRPAEHLVATYRALGVQPDTPATFKNNNPNASPFLQGLRDIRSKMERLGQYPTGQPTPNGYPDAYVAWTSTGTMVGLWNEALNIIDGRQGMFTHLAPENLLGTTPPATAGAYVDALTQRLVGTKFSTKNRDLLLAVAGVPATAPVNASFNGAIRAVARTILASPQHHLR